MSAFALIAAVAGSVITALAGGEWLGRRDRKACAKRRHPASQTVKLPQREPGAAKAVIDAGVTREERYAHLDAVWAQCSDSEPYVAAMLASHEAEVTHLLELALELDDQAPRGGDQRGHVAE